MPFDNADPSPTHKISNRKSWNLPIMTKFNMTNTKTKVSKNAFTWSGKLILEYKSLMFLNSCTYASFH